MGKKTSDDQAIGRRLIQARQAAGMFQREVANRLYISRETVALIESGSTRIKANDLWRMARIYGVTIDWLMQDIKEYENPCTGESVSGVE